ncbi:MAG: tetratricopeptide repeat protein [Planctomycetota bacterium]|jgi:Tol biopolymer transport system component
MKTIAIFPVLMIVLVISVTAKTETVPEAEQHFEKANELLKHMDYQGAITEYNKVISLSSNSKIAQDAQYWIGQSHFKAGQFDAAKATFAKLIETYPTSAIIPVTKLMVERVEQAKKDEVKRKAMSNTADKGFIIDPDTGVKYTKTASFTGKNDVIEDTTYPTRQGCLELSPNGKFLLYKKLVVPLDGSEPFDLVDFPATHCTWSPDGSKVAFNSEGDIWVVPVSPHTARPTGLAKKLHDGNYRFRTKLSWSPDSEKLVFSRPPDRIQRIPGGDIWCLSVKDGPLTQITSHPGRKRAPAWSPDGKTIAYGMKEERYQNRYSLCLISAGGSVPRKVTELGERIFPMWSPDGKWILSKLSEKIHLFGLNDNRQLELIPPRAVGDFFSMSPDGNKMCFYRPSYGYKYDIKVVSATGGPPFDLGRQITLYPEHLWTPDSKMIIAEGGNKDGRYGVWISPLSGGKPVFLEMDVSVDGGPVQIIAISPNTQKLAFSVDLDDGTEDLYVVPISLQDARTKGSAVKVFDGLYRETGTNVTTSWSPDGKKLAVIHRGDVWVASSNEEKPVQITESPEMEIWPGWSPDRRMINYIAYAGGERTFYVKPASGGEAKKIPGADRTSAWSPDSKKLVIQSEGTISIVSVADGKTRQIAKLNDLGLERIFYFSWSPDGKYIACVGKHIEKGDAGPIYLIPAEEGEATTLVTNDTSCKYLLHWSPDGKWISYNSEGSVKVRPEGALWKADFDEILAKAPR